MKKTQLYYKVATTLYEHNFFDEKLCFDILRLRRIALKLKRIDENTCNGWPRYTGVEDEEWRKRDEAAEARLEETLQKIGERWDMNIIHQHDPRGWTVQNVVFHGIDLGEFVNN